MNKEKFYILQNVILIIISLVIILIFFFIVLLNINYISNFEDACKNLGGNFYQLQNTSCKYGHEDCIYICNLNGKYYDLDEVGKSIYYGKYFCIEDRSYINKLNNGIICVC